MANEFYLDERVKKYLANIDLQKMQEDAGSGNMKAQTTIDLFYTSPLVFEAVFGKDNVASFMRYLELAESGNVAAQYHVAFCYAYGLGADKDENEAVAWFEKSAEAGYAPALNFLGYCYKIGLFVEKKTDVALELFLKASEQGFSKATTNLGACYFEQKQFDEAIKLFEKIPADEYCDGAVPYTLALCYTKGICVPCDTKKAMDYMIKAVNLHYVPAQKYVTKMMMGLDMGKKSVGIKDNEDDLKLPQWFEEALFLEGEKEFFDVKIDLGERHGILSYYMTDNYQKLENYLKSRFGYHAPLPRHFRDNDALSQNVRAEMKKRECVFSVTVLDDGTLVINFYDGDVPKIVMASLKKR